MKAIELLRHMDKDAELAEYGMIIDLSADHGIKPWFGENARQTAGHIRVENGENPFFALWQSVDRTYGFIENHTADAVIETENDTIYLWRIEQ